MEPFELLDERRDDAPATVADEAQPGSQEDDMDGPPVMPGPWVPPTLEHFEPLGVPAES